VVRPKASPRIAAAVAHAEIRLIHLTVSWPDGCVEKQALANGPRDSAFDSFTLAFVSLRILIRLPECKRLQTLVTYAEIWPGRGVSAGRNDGAVIG